MFQINKRVGDVDTVARNGLTTPQAAKIVLNCIKDTALAKGEKVYYGGDDQLVCGAITYTIVRS